jgi:hypothetical protein
MTKRDREPANDRPADPLLARLRALPPARLDDVAAARTLARAEAALAPPAAVARARSHQRWLVPAALVVWGAMYAARAVGELARVYPATAASTTVASLTIGSGSRSGATHSARARGDISSARE